MKYFVQIYTMNEWKSLITTATQPCCLLSESDVEGTQLNFVVLQKNTCAKYMKMCKTIPL